MESRLQFFRPMYRWVDIHSEQPQTVCAHRTRPPEWFGLERFHAMVETSFTASSKIACDHSDYAV